DTGPLDRCRTTDIQRNSHRPASLCRSTVYPVRLEVRKTQDYQVRRKHIRGAGGRSEVTTHLDPVRTPSDAVVGVHRAVELQRPRLGVVDGDEQALQSLVLSHVCAWEGSHRAKNGI